MNPVVILPGALQTRLESIAEEFTASCLMGTGQFCTNPGFVVLLRDAHSDTFVARVGERFSAAPVGTLLSSGVAASLKKSIDTLHRAGAEVVTGERLTTRAGYCCPNTLLKVSGSQFLGQPEVFQIEAFGNASLCVLADDAEQLCMILGHLEGNLTGCVYSDRGGADDELYDHVAVILRQKVGRLLNDKMPTGVAVSSAMNHGGPYPATGHPGFTAVGIPAALRRFAVLQCYDDVRSERLPAGLRDANPNGDMWRWIDRRWTQEGANTARK